MFIIKHILVYILKETEEELYQTYKTEVLDCHPFDTPVPISFEQWKEQEEG